MDSDKLKGGNGPSQFVCLLSSGAPNELFCKKDVLQWVFAGKIDPVSYVAGKMKYVCWETFQKTLYQMGIIAVEGDSRIIGVLHWSVHGVLLGYSWSTLRHFWSTFGHFCQEYFSDTFGALLEYFGGIVGVLSEYFCLVLLEDF